MPLIPIREAAYQRIATALSTTGTPVERNRRAPLEPREMPVLVLRDAGHAARQDDAAGLMTYILTVTVEGYVAADETDLGRAISDLHASVVLTLVGRPFSFGSPPDELWISETRMDPDSASLTASESPLGNFTAEFECELRTAIATGPFITSS